MQTLVQQIQRVLSTTLLVVSFGIPCWGEIVIFSENMGTAEGAISIADNVFQNSDPITFSGTASTASTTPSSIYTGASGGRNVFFTSTAAVDFLISGINTSDFENLTLSFGHHKSTIAGNNELLAEVSADGENWTNLSYNRETGSGTANWILIEPTGIIPAASNLRIRFTQTTTTNTAFRIDDIILRGSPLEGVPIVSTMGSAAPLSTLEGTASLSTSITVLGTNLTENITATAPSSFELSNNDSTWGATINLPAVGGTLYIRLAESTPAGTYSGNVTLTSPGAPQNNVAVSGTVISLNPKLTNPPYSYSQDFSSFTNATSLPPGWSVESSTEATTYQGDWGSGTSAGLRGNDNVLGYQNTTSSGTLTVNLTIENETGVTIKDLLVSYTGRVERVTQTRFPVWTVSVAASEVPELAYSTADGVDKSISHLISGLNIRNGQSITISWTTENGEGSNANRQIGIADVSVIAPNIQKPTVLILF